MNNSSIHIITAITGVDSSNPFNLRLGDERCIGWFPTYEEAKTAILNDIFSEENYCRYYHWFVIEELPVGCCKGAINRTWFHWDCETQSFKEVPEFQDLEMYPNIGIG